MKCPTHDIEMIRRQTKYGPLHVCLDEECSMMKWGDGPDTTPADAETREIRHLAHQIFDKLWIDGHMTRTEAYMELSSHLRRLPALNHIGLFDVATCEKVIEFAEAEQRRILSEKFE